MKYIRTKDGKIYQVIDEQSNGQVIVKTHLIGKKRDINNSVDGTRVKGRWEIIAQADTIEELCDYLIVKEHSFDQPFSPIGRFLGELRLSSSWKKAIEDGRVEWVKGAIWTDKGLIYVAKMNDKGELELL